MEQTHSPAKKLPGIGELFNMSKDMIMKRKEFFLTLAAIPAIIQFIGVLLMEVSLAMAPLMIILIILAAIVGVLASIAMVQAMADEKMTDWKKALSGSKGLFWPYVWAGILVAIVIMIGFILLVIPGIYLSVLFTFYLFTLVLDNKRGWEAAEASKHLVKGHWWAVVGRLIGFFLPLVLLAGLIGGIVSVTGSEILVQLVSAVINIIITPLSVAYTYFMYKSLKSMKGEMKKEA